MIFLSILILIVAIALPTISQNIRSILYVRISSIIFIYAGALAFNAFYIQSIGSGIGIYSGLFQVTTISQCLDHVNAETLILSSFFIYTNNKRQNLLNLISVILLIVLMYLSFDDLTFYQLPGVMLSFIFSFLIFYFIYYRINFSKNIYIRLLQKFVVLNLCFISSILLASLLDLYIFQVFFLAMET